MGMMVATADVVGEQCMLDRGDCCFAGIEWCAECCCCTCNLQEIEEARQVHIISKTLGILRWDASIEPLLLAAELHYA